MQTVIATRASSPKLLTVKSHASAFSGKGVLIAKKPDAVIPPQLPGLGAGNRKSKGTSGKRSSGSKKRSAAKTSDTKLSSDIQAEVAAVASLVMGELGTGETDNLDAVINSAISVGVDSKRTPKGSADRKPFPESPVAEELPDDEWLEQFAPEVTFCGHCHELRPGELCELLLSRRSMSQRSLKCASRHLPFATCTQRSLMTM